MVKGIRNLIVTGTEKRGPMKFYQGHWIPDACQNDRALGSSYTSISIAGVNGIYCHQLLAAARYGRRAMIGASRDKNDDGTPDVGKSGKSSALVVSHLCLDVACVNPHHLVIESQLDNIRRQECHRSFRCTVSHSAPACIMEQRVIAKELEDIMSKKLVSVGFVDRIKDPTVLNAKQLFLNPKPLPCIDDLLSQKDQWKEVLANIERVSSSKILKFGDELIRLGLLRRMQEEHGSE